jgi:hypothetical protein
MSRYFCSIVVVVVIIIIIIIIIIIMRILIHKRNISDARMVLDLSKTGLSGLNPA